MHLSTDLSVNSTAQELPAVMFCSEDRAMTCRRCDLMIHTANQFTKTHHR